MNRDEVERVFHAQLKGFTTKPQQGRIMDMFRRTLRELVVDVMLACPKCGRIHIDKPEEATEGKERWANPPHRSHLCAHCGTIWRPSDYNTNGVARVKTRGGADTWPVVVAAKLDNATVDALRRTNVGSDGLSDQDRATHERDLQAWIDAGSPEAP